MSVMAELVRKSQSKRPRKQNRIFYSTHSSATTTRQMLMFVPFSLYKPDTDDDAVREEVGLFTTFCSSVLCALNELLFDGLGTSNLLRVVQAL